MRHFLSWYIHICWLFVFSYLIPFNFTEEKKTLIFVPFSDRLSLEEWEQQMACWKTHLARAPAGKSFFCFCDRQHKRHWFNREEQNSIGFHPSPQVHVLQFLTWLVTAWWWGGVPRSERHQIVFPRWRCTDISTLERHGNKKRNNSLDVE